MGVDDENAISSSWATILDRDEAKNGSDGCSRKRNKLRIMELKPVSLCVKTLRQQQSRYCRQNRSQNPSDCRHRNHMYDEGLSRQGCNNPCRRIVRRHISTSIQEPKEQCLIFLSITSLSKPFSISCAVMLLGTTLIGMSRATSTSALPSTISERSYYKTPPARRRSPHLSDAKEMKPSSKNAWLRSSRNIWTHLPWILMSL